MNKKVIVWGTGNVGRPAIRAVVSNSELELAGVVVANPKKKGLDAGALAGIADTGIIATDDWRSLLDSGIDAVVYTATADTRPEEALEELLSCLRAGANVVSTSFYSFLHPALTPPELKQALDAACEAGNSSLFVSGIDPGWAMDVLPILASGMVSDIREIRCQEIFNYALYDQPDVVRHVIGFGGSMDELPLMLHDFSLRLVWEPMVRLVAEGLGVELDDVKTLVERRPLEKTIQVEGMGQFDRGSQGAFRFEVQGLVDGRPLFVVEHITRIDDDCAPDWPYPPEGRGCHRVLIAGNPDLNMTIHGHDSHEPGPAGGGNATAANRIVNALVAVCEASPGLVTPLDLPTVTGRAQLARAG